MGKELTIKQKKDFAKSLFLKEHITQKEIAERVGVSTVTINKWVNTEKWEMLKTSLSITREEQLGNIYRQISEINITIAKRPEGERFATSKEADIINKLAASIRQLEKETGIGEIVGVSKGLLDFIRRNEPGKAKELSYYIDAYIKEKLNS